MLPYSHSQYPLILFSLQSRFALTPSQLPSLSVKKTLANRQEMLETLVMLMEVGAQTATLRVLRTDCHIVKQLAS